MPVCCLGKKQLVNNTPSSFYKFPELPNNIFYQSSGSHPPSYSMGSEIFSQRYSGWGSEFDHSPQSSSEVRHEQSCTPTHGVQRDSVIFILYSVNEYIGPGSSVGIATDYGLEGPGSNPGGDEIFHPSRPVLGPTQPPGQWVLGLSRG